MTNQRKDRIRILHVVESLVGGVATAVEDYIRNTPELEHYVLGCVRAGFIHESSLSRLATSIVPMATGHRARITQLNQLLPQVAPTIVHAHSSLAGAYVRLSKARSSHPIVYTPHCYAFERRDISFAARAAIKAVESALNSRTTCVAAVSHRERDLALALRPRTTVEYVPNVSWPRTVRAVRGHEGLLRTVTVGRVCAQKNPRFLAETASLTRSIAEWTWIGGGDKAQSTELEAAGVSLTGWLERADAIRRLEDADVYVHTAAWEGAPIAVLEAAAFGLPILAKRTAALEALGVKRLYDSPSTLADGLTEMLDVRKRERAAFESLAIAQCHGPQLQRAALLRAYAAATGEVPEASAVLEGLTNRGSTGILLAS